MSKNQGWYSRCAHLPLVFKAVFQSRVRADARRAERGAELLVAASAPGSAAVDDVANLNGDDDRGVELVLHALKCDERSVDTAAKVGERLWCERVRRSACV